MKHKTWTHNCQMQSPPQHVCVETGCPCPWCGAYSSVETNYCQRCGLLTHQLTNDLCPDCNNIVQTINSTDTLGDEAANINTIPNYKEICYARKC